MGASFVAVFTDEAGEVEVAWAKVEPHFFLGLAAGAGVGRLTMVATHLASGWAPFAEVGVLRALEQ